MVEAAAGLGYAALALADVDEVGGVVRAHGPARGGLHLLYGAKLTLHDAPPVVAIAKAREGWRPLCRLPTQAKTQPATAGKAHRSREERRPVLSLAALLAVPPGELITLLTGSPTPEQARALALHHGDDAGLLVSCGSGPGEVARHEHALALYANMAGGSNAQIKAVVPTGSGGLWTLQSLTTLQYNGAALVELVLGTKEATHQLHPALHALQ